MDKLNKNLEDINKSSEKLRDNLDKVDVKTNQLSVSAKDVATTYKKEFQDVMNYLVLQMSKIGAILLAQTSSLCVMQQKNTLNAKVC